MILKLVAETTKVWHGEGEKIGGVEPQKVFGEWLQNTFRRRRWQGRMESGLPHKFTLTVASGVFDIPLGWEATIDTQYTNSGWLSITIVCAAVQCGGEWSGAIYIINDFSTCVSGSLSSVEKQFYLLFRFSSTLSVCVCVPVLCVNLLFIVCCELNAKIC